MTKSALLRTALLAGLTFVTTHAAALAQTGANAVEDSGAQIYAGVAASVNDEPITIGDVANRARLILLSLGVAPNEQTIIQAQQRALESLIDETLQIQEASEFEIAISDDELEREFARLAASNSMSSDQFRSDLLSQGVDPETLRQQLRADVSWQRLVGGRYGSRVRVSELQIDDRLERLEKTLNEEQLRVSEIFLPAYSREQLSQMVQGAWDLRQQIQEGAPFALVARQFSGAPTASNGGDLGWLPPGQLKPEISDAIIGLTPPAISEPVVTDDGVYLVALLDRRAPVQRELAGFELMQLEQTTPGASLDAAAQAVSSCATMNRDVDAFNGVKAVSLGALDLVMLSPIYAEMFSATQEGGFTPAINLPNGNKAMVMICERIQTGPALPSRDQMEDQLREQQISLLADRYLRDLKREATILRR